ncbi:MAG TPA: FAD-dependent oxidoreductase, partial [Thermoleophilaceae bacterium]|nr:FAD-dependent oxidoreductase [Thermoleophilaceae bacterium]
VRTDRGDVACEVVVNAGGMYAAEIGRLAGVRVPVVPMAHEYLVTQPFRDRGGEHLPTLRDPDHLIYFREEGGGLVMGGYERSSAPWAVDRGLDAIPADFNGRLLEEDWDRLDEIVANSRMRVPAMEDARIVRLINGPEAFTPDGEFCLGETEVRGLFVAAGFCAHGLAGAGGVGKAMAEWIAGGEPPLDLWHMDVRRFGAHHRSPRHTLARVREVYETYYDIKYPHHERTAGRPLRLSPAYEWHRGHGAAFGEKSGWERVNWYAANEAAGDGALRPRGWAGRHWSPAIGAEHRACREAAALFDETSFAKLEVSGPGAAELLERLCDNHVAREIGQITYTQMLNSRGGVECDFTVARLEEERFSIVTGTAFGRHDLAWISRHARDGVRVEDVTSRWACAGLWGPRARDVLAAACTEDLGFGYMRLRELAVGDVPVRALRVTYVGELGWELYCPMEYGGALWRTLWEAGRPLGLVAGGYRAIDSLRLEKGYRVWGADVTPDDDPYEAGLGFCVKRDKSFLGREALGDGRPDRRLCCLLLAEARAVALGNEPVRAGDRVAGRVTTGGYGYTVGRSIAYAYLPAEHAEPGTSVAVEVFGDWIDAEVAAEPLFDPAGERIRGG